MGWSKALSTSKAASPKGLFGSPVLHHFDHRRRADPSLSVGGFPHRWYHGNTPPWMTSVVPTAAAAASSAGDAARYCHPTPLTDRCGTARREIRREP